MRLKGERGIALRFFLRPQPLLHPHHHHHLFHPHHQTNSNPTSYLPVYLQDVLGLSNSKIGNLQAIAQFLCNASKSLSGTLADVLSPARMVIFGTLLTTLNKPMFAASGWVYASFGTLATLYWITAGKVFDRMSKGIREAPGKALIGDLAAASGDSPEGAFGLRQALATTGALLGSAIAGLAYKLSGQNYVLTFALAAAPAAAALVLTVGAFGPMAAESAAKKKQAAADEAAAVAAGELRVDSVMGWWGWCGGVEKPKVFFFFFFFFHT
jgi:nitrate/nitrite transporter NarK